MSTAVVAAVWGDYARFVPRWLASIEAQTLRPDQVVIACPGGDLEVPEASLPVCVVADPCAGMGAAWNAAVAGSTTEWVVRLDIDDTLLPVALEDVSRLTSDADVVSVGALRDGREHLFTNVTREHVLTGRQGCYSCAAFRRAFWVKRPFITVNDWVDSMFWLGLAKEGARFAGTARPGFVYQQHEDSYSHLLSAEDRRRAIKQLRMAVHED